VATDSDIFYEKLFNVLQIMFDSNSSMLDLRSNEFHETASLSKLGLQNNMNNQKTCILSNVHR
jgi:hypothetical protein